MSAGNINWAFGDGGNVEDLIEAAAHYNYELCEDGKWRESCVRCKGLHYSRADEFKPGQACDICDGLGYLKGEGFYAPEAGGRQRARDAGGNAAGICPELRPTWSSDSV